MHGAGAGNRRVAVVTTYLLVNLAFFLALPFADVMSANSGLYPAALPIATKAAQTFLGVAGIAAISVLFVVSSLSAMHGSILTSARVPYAMANDKLFFPQLGVLNGKNVPMTSVLLQGLIASVLAFLGTFNQLTQAAAGANRYRAARHSPAQTGWLHPAAHC